MSILSNRKRAARRASLVAGLASLATATLATLAPGALQAQTWPDKPIRIVVPFGAGGAVDIIARAIGQEMAKRLGQPVVVENRTGAGGNIAAEHVIRSAPDGYTLLMASPGNAVNATLYPRLPFNPATDYTQVALIAGVPTAMLAGPATPGNNFQEFLAAARSAKAPLNFASGGAGTTEHLAAEMLKAKAGLQMTHIPYKGGAPAMNDLMGGQVQLMFTNLSQALPFIRAGKMRLFAVASAERNPTFPDVPTFVELGYPDFKVSVWWGLMGPPKMSPEVVNRINATVNEAIAGPEMKARLESMTATAMNGTPKQFADFFQQEIRSWGAVVRASGATAE
jgi:tripartite-type tricarboxylate transporter receptor subunit TctC